MLSQNSISFNRHSLSSALEVQGIDFLYQSRFLTRRCFLAVLVDTGLIQHHSRLKALALQAAPEQ
jgi:hypothetical protein